MYLNSAVTEVYQLPPKNILNFSVPRSAAREQVLESDVLPLTD